MNPQAGYLMSLALEYIQKKDLDAAERLINRALKLSPKDSEIFRLSGIVYALKGNPEKALEMFDSSIKSDPKNFLAHSNRGNVLRDLRKYDLALKSFDRAIALQSRYAEVYSNKGNLLQSVEEFDAAIEHYKKAIAIDSDNPDFHYNLGNAYQEKLQYDAAIEHYKKAIALNPYNPDIYGDLGNAYQEKSQYDAAIEHYKKAIAIDSDNPDFHYNLGNAYQEKSQYDAAIEHYKKAIALNPYNPDFYNNLGHIFWGLNRLKLARINYEKALSIAPEHANAHNNLAHLELYGFNFMEGWSHYEYRWLIDRKDRPTLIVTSKPQWNGAPKDGRLLIWAEQGIGDQILYGSILKDLESYPQEKIVSVNKKLIPIFQRSFPDMEIIDKEMPIPDHLYDEQISFGGLGKLFRSELNSFDTQRPFYLTAKNSNQSNVELNHHKNLIRCGLSWRSSNKKLGENKSMSLMEMAPVLELAGVTFINLQYGDVKDEIGSVNAEMKTSIQMVNNVDLFEDIEGLIDIIEGCNIVITTSNSTAHLAGAIGKETLLLLPFGHGRFWYWHDIDGVSLWYPSIKVFKQENLGDWSAPIEAVKAYLEKRFEI